nr:MAG TPA: hypothetical protein [Caudoviricetes sp.]
MGYKEEPSIRRAPKNQSSVFRPSFSSISSGFIPAFFAASMTDFMVGFFFGCRISSFLASRAAIAS